MSWYDKYSPIILELCGGNPGSITSVANLLNNIVESRYEMFILGLIRSELKNENIYIKFKELDNDVEKCMDYFEKMKLM